MKFHSVALMGCVALFSTQASAACISEANGTSINGKPFPQKISANSEDRDRTFKMSQGTHTIMIKVTGKNPKPLQFDVAASPTSGQVLLCNPAKKNGPGTDLQCRVKISSAAVYYVRVRNSGSTTVSYNMICANG